MINPVLCRSTPRLIPPARSGRIRMRMSNTSESTRMSERKSRAMYGSTSQRTHPPPGAVATPSMAMIAPAWYRTKTMPRTILPPPRKERRNEGSLGDSRIRRSVPKKSAKHTRERWRECVQLNPLTHFPYKSFCSDRKRETAPVRGDAKCATSPICTTASPL
jgi:hypothetical protein